MVSFPNAKINIGLQVLEKRKDGYHNLNSIFYPLGLRDALEIISAEAPQTEDVLFSSSGRVIDGKASDNLCMKAYALLKKDFPQLPHIKLHLHKNIPMGAGLGGGSADGAFMLSCLNEKYDLQLTKNQLIEYALELGSDCPFFILNKPCFAAGRGELLEEIPVNLSEHNIILVNPGIHVNTGEAFKSVQLNPAPLSLKECIRQPIESWRNVIVNDFEKPVFEKYTEIQNIKSLLYDNGATYASMSGSGSTVYGIFPKNQPLSLKFPDHYFQKWV